MASMGGGNSKSNGGGAAVYLHLQLQLVVSCIFAVALLSLTTQPQAVAAYGRQASTPAGQFLQSICNSTVVERKYVAYCYDVLLSQAEALKGSHIKVVGAAVSHMVKNLDQSRDEMTKFKATPAGAPFNFAPCIALASEGVRDAGAGGVPAVAKLKSLEAAGDDKIGQPDLDALTKWVDKLDAGYKSVCVREEIYQNNPNSESIEAGTVPTLEFNEYDIAMCHDLIKNYNTPKKAQPAQ